MNFVASCSAASWVGNFSHFPVDVELVESLRDFEEKLKIKSSPTSRDDHASHCGAVIDSLSITAATILDQADGEMLRAPFSMDASCYVEFPSDMPNLVQNLVWWF
jgi:hypothetical protein